MIVQAKAIKILDPSEIKEHALRGGIFGIEKAGMERTDPLKAAEMSTEDDYGMIDGIINNGPKEEKSADKGEKPPLWTDSKRQNLNLQKINRRRKRNISQTGKYEQKPKMEARMELLFGQGRKKKV